jgi:hypothetical protein
VLTAEAQGICLYRRSYPGTERTGTRGVPSESPKGNRFFAGTEKAIDPFSAGAVFGRTGKTIQSKKPTPGISCLAFFPSQHIQNRNFCLGALE